MFQVKSEDFNLSICVVPQMQKLTENPAFKLKCCHKTDIKVISLHFTSSRFQFKLQALSRSRWGPIKGNFSVKPVRGIITSIQMHNYQWHLYKGALMQRGAHCSTAAVSLWTADLLHHFFLAERRNSPDIPSSGHKAVHVFSVCRLSFQKVTVSFSPNSPKSDVSATAREKVGPDASVVSTTLALMSQCNDTFHAGFCHEPQGGLSQLDVSWDD